MEIIKRVVEVIKMANIYYLCNIVLLGLIWIRLGNLEDK